VKNQGRKRLKKYRRSSGRRKKFPFVSKEKFEQLELLLARSFSIISELEKGKKKKSVGRPVDVKGLIKKLKKAERKIVKLKKKKTGGRRGRKPVLAMAKLKAVASEKKVIKKELTKAKREIGRLEKTTLENAGLKDELEKTYQIAKRLKEYLAKANRPILKDFPLPSKNPIKRRISAKDLFFERNGEINFCVNCRDLFGVSDPTAEKVVNQTEGVYVRYKNKYYFSFFVFRIFLEDNKIKTYTDYLKARGKIKLEENREFYPEIPEEVYDTICFEIPTN
jgi:hypothetical protein